MLSGRFYSQAFSIYVSLLEMRQGSHVLFVLKNMCNLWPFLCMYVNLRLACIICIYIYIIFYFLF